MKLRKRIGGRGLNGHLPVYANHEFEWSAERALQKFQQASVPLSNPVCLQKQEDSFAVTHHSPVPRVILFWQDQVVWRLLNQ